MTTGLMLAFGSIVVVAVVVVLYISLFAAQQNTFRLLGVQAGLISLNLEGRIEDILLPTRAAVEEFARAVETGRLDVDDRNSLRSYIMSAVTATPHMSSLGLMTELRGGVAATYSEGQFQFIPISETGRATFNEEIANLASQRNKIARHETRWGEMIRVDEDTVILNVRRPLKLDDGQVAIIAAGILVNDLSREVAAAGHLVRGTAFVLYNEKFVLAHPNMAGDFRWKKGGHPLPSISEFNDPVLKAYIDPTSRREGAENFSASTGIQILFDENDDDRPIILRPYDGVKGLPLKIGIYFPPNTGDEIFGPIINAGLAGLAVLAIALIVAYFVSRYLAAPITRLAIAAEHVRRLELDQVTMMSESRVREIDRAADAFDGMISALRWFQTYVPRQLANRLIGREALPASQARDISVLFTDIVGFSSRAEKMTATDTAKFLNAHFTLLGNCIEAEGGLIDKYVGDAVMAFWGAPDEQPDHANRACRAALAIRAAIEQDNLERRAKGLPEVRIRIGIHSGEALVGNIGAPGRINYTIVGDTVNIASRLEAFGKHLGREPDHPSDKTVEITVSSKTLAGAKLATEAVEIGPRQVPGIEEPVHIWCL